MEDLLPPGLCDGLFRGGKNLIHPFVRNLAPEHFLLSMPRQAEGHFFTHPSQFTTTVNGGASSSEPAGTGIRKRLPSALGA